MSSPATNKPLGLRERKKRDAKRAIRSAALGLFAQNGYEAVSVEQIAAAADVSRTTFFNYFPTKEAVITEPGPEALEAQRALCVQRPLDEPLWASLTAVILQSLIHAESSIVALKRIKASSPAMAPVIHKASETTIAGLREWAETRVPDEQRGLAQLQLNVAMAAMTTVFAQWESQEDFNRFLELARNYLNQLDGAFV